MTFWTDIVNFFLRLLGRESRKQETPSERVSLASLDAFLREKNAPELKEIELESAKFKARIAKSFADLKDEIIKLRETKGADSFSKAAVEIKNNFCNKGISILSRPLAPGEENADFIAKAKLMIEDINYITPRQAAHMSVFFREHLDVISSRLKSIKSEIGEFEEFLSTSILSDIESMRSEMREIKENQKKIEYIEKNISEIEKEVAELKDAQEKMESRIPEFDKAKTDALKEGMGGLMKEKQSIEQEIETEFGILGKTLRKYAHLIKDRHSKSLAEKYADSPSATFLEHDKGMEIKKILAEAKALSDRSELEMEEKKKIHLCSLLSNMQDLKKLRERHEKVMKKICEIESELLREEKQMEKIKRMQEEVKEKKNRINEALAMKRQLEDTKRKSKEANDQKLREMEFRINSVMGIDVKIEY